MAEIVYWTRGDKRKEFAEKVLDIFKDQIGKRVLIKPNQVSYEPYPTTTHPQMLRAVIGELQKREAEILCGDGQAIDAFGKKMRNTDLKQIAKELKIEFLNFYRLEMQTFITAYNWKIKMIKLPFKVDTVISLPVLKSHPKGRLRMTGALKNVVGYFSAKERAQMHLPVISKDPWQTIAQANWLLKYGKNPPKQIIIMDGFQTLIKANELRHGGKLADLGYLMAGQNPVALDIFGFNLLKKVEPQYEDKEYTYVKYIPIAIDIGLGSPIFDAVEVKL